MTKKTLCLAIDTTSDCTSVALLDSEGRLASLVSTLSRGQGECLMGLIQNLFDEYGCTSKDLTCLAVAVGPGSFTGVRIGLATARGLALALNIPVYGVNNFLATAYGLHQPVKVVLDSKRADYFVQDFDAFCVPLNEPALLDELALKSSLPFTAVGSGATLLADEIGCEVISPVAPLALNVAHIALWHSDLVQEPHPLYLREADVTL